MEKGAHTRGLLRGKEESGQKNRKTGCPSRKKAGDLQKRKKYTPFTRRTHRSTPARRKNPKRKKRRSPKGRKRAPSQISRRKQKDNRDP